MLIRDDGNGTFIITCDACDASVSYTSKDLRAAVKELRALREALTLIRDQAEPQHPTGTWARDVARKALAKAKEARG